MKPTKIAQTKDKLCIYFAVIFMLGFTISEDEIKAVAELSGALEIEDDYLTADFRLKCEQVVPDPGKVKSTEYVQTYLTLKANIS